MVFWGGGKRRREEVSGEEMRRGRVGGEISKACIYLYISDWRKVSEWMRAITLLELLFMES